MTSTATPFGLKPMFHPTGNAVVPEQGTILSGYATAIYANSPVKIGTDGNIQAAAVGDRFVGSFQGCEFTGADGRRKVSNQWTASTVAADAICYYTSDPMIVYSVQANGSLAQATIGESADFATVTGNTSTGFSTGAMSATTSSSTIAQLVVHGLGRGVDNAWGDAFTVVLVRIGKHQFTASPAAF